MSTIDSSSEDGEIPRPLPMQEPPQPTGKPTDDVLLNQWLLLSNDGRPNSITECRKKGKFDALLYSQYQAKLDEMQELEAELWNDDDSDDSDDEDGASVKPKQKRSCKAIPPYFLNDDGSRTNYTPQMTYWYLRYINNPPVDDPRFHKEFRNRFRIPHAQFIELCERLKVHPLFERWTKPDALGLEPKPIGLLILSSLKYLGRGLTFDDCFDATAISNETIRTFFHVFITWGSTDFFDEMVKMPTTAADVEPHLPEFTKAGMDGAIGSTDATHVPMWNCYYSHKHLHTGGKIKHMPARTYNVTCNHRRKILYTTKGHPARWNDKTLIWHDRLVSGIKENKILQDHTFELLERDKDGVVSSQKYRGPWVLTDNGYLSWSCTMAPIKQPYTYDQKRWSEWVESMRKDVECLFGILKGRWRILKTGVRLHGADATDKVWLTCCAFHNWLLEVDGLDKTWQHGARSDWQGGMGKNDVYTMRLHGPSTFNRMSDNQLQEFGETNLGVLNFASYLGRRKGVVIDLEGDEFYDEASGDEASVMDDAIHVNSLSYYEFRNKLFENFDIRHLKGDVAWPTRNTNGKVPANLRNMFDNRR